MNTASRLSQRQWRFASEYVLGEHAGDATACYRVAYGHTGESADWLRSNASKLLQNPRVQETIDTLRQEVREVHDLTPESHVLELQRIRDLAIACGDLASAARCEKYRGEVAGFYLKHPRAEKPQGTLEENLLQAEFQFKQLARSSPTFHSFITRVYRAAQGEGQQVLPAEPYFGGREIRGEYEGGSPPPRGGTRLTISPLYNICVAHVVAPTFRGPFDQP